MVVYRSAWLLETDFNETAIADLIFVSNLNNEAWTALDVPGDTAWFEKRLLKNFPNAQTFLYQYHGTHTSLADTVSDAAAQLLSEWDKLEKAESRRFMTESLLTSSQLSRPVIFVCHGLGGLVVKKALLWAEAQSKIPLVLRRTFGVVFVGTPHASETPDSAEFQRRTSLLSDACFSSMEENGERSEYLLHISHAFPRIGGLYMSVNFCQSPCSGARALHPDCLWSMISQSQISQHEEKHWVISEHCSEDIINSNIGICTEYMIEVAAQMSHNGRSLLTSAQEAKDKYSKERLGNTGEWLLALKSYRNWIRAEGPSLLWLHGLPGTGKSTLCSAVIDDLRSFREEKDLVIYCFLEDAPGRPDSARYILRTIAYQLRASHYPLAPDHLLRSILKTVEIETETDEITSEVFKQSLRDLFWAIDSQARISLVIDGTESADGTSSIVVDEIVRANSSRRSSERLKCAISTRSPFQVACCKGSCFEINLSNEPGAQCDLKAFALARLTSYSPADSCTRHLSAESLARQLCSRANGSFLWVALAADSLQQVQSPVLLPKEIESLPSTIDGFYQMELGRIPASDVRIAQSVFSWLTVATRTLHFTELLNALAITAETRQGHVCTGSPLTNGLESGSNQIVMQICRGLVVVNEKGCVTFRHPSVRRHLLYSTRQHHPEHTLFLAHEHVAGTCLMLLNTREHARPSLFRIDTSQARTQTERQSVCLQDYAAANWSFHYRLAETRSKILAGTLQRCISMTLGYACETFSISRTSRSTQIATTTLCICAKYGFVILTQICLEMGFNPNEGACHYCETPLSIAAAGVHAPVAILLLRKTVHVAGDIRYGSERILQLAAAHGSLATIELLLARGGDANAINHCTGRRPLHNAAASGHLSVVKLLMAHGADVNAVIPDTQEAPLHLAALYGHIAVVKYLLDGQEASSKDMELYDRIVEQPYFRAWTENLLEIDGDFGKLSCETTRPIAEEYVKELLSRSQRYTDINMSTREGWTAVHLAASKGHEAIVGLLLERGATLQVTGDTTCNALQIAAEYGHLATVKLLLAAGASLSGESERIGSILGRIRANGHHIIVEILLWHAFISQNHGSTRKWALLSLAIKSKYVTKHRAMAKRRVQKQTTRARSLRSNHSPFMQDQIC